MSAILSSMNKITLINVCAARPRPVPGLSQKQRLLLMNPLMPLLTFAGSADSCDVPERD